LRSRITVKKMYAAVHAVYAADLEVYSGKEFFT